MSDYHERHEPYITCVAGAFDDAGIKTLTFYADPNDPRDGAIQLDPAMCGAYAEYEEVWVSWQEERGWAIVPYLTRHGQLKAHFVEDLDDIALIAAPTTVVAEFCSRADLKWTGEPDGFEDVDFPGHFQEDDENPRYEAALAVYATGGAA